jgi:hypothetical protein
MTNPEFEAALAQSVRDNLRKELDADRYINATLNEMWNGETYRDQDGDVCYHEIGKQFTHHGRPVVIS